MCPVLEVDHLDVRMYMRIWLYKIVSRWLFQILLIFPLEVDPSTSKYCNLTSVFQTGDSTTTWICNLIPAPSLCALLVELPRGHEARGPKDSPVESEASGVELWFSFCRSSGRRYRCESKYHGIYICTKDLVECIETRCIMYPLRHRNSFQKPPQKNMGRCSTPFLPSD